VAAAEAVLELTDGVGVDAALECVGTAQAFTTAMAVTRPGGMVGYVGAPHGVDVSRWRIWSLAMSFAGGRSLMDIAEEL
jgi:threonine dehydrogenase-like Zn-dependent dehydrogenase